MAEYLWEWPPTVTIVTELTSKGDRSIDVELLPTLTVSINGLLNEWCKTEHKNHDKST